MDISKCCFLPNRASLHCHENYFAHRPAAGPIQDLHVIITRVSTVKSNVMSTVNNTCINPPLRPLQHSVHEVRLHLIGLKLFLFFFFRGSIVPRVNDHHFTPRHPHNLLSSLDTFTAPLPFHPPTPIPPTLLPKTNTHLPPFPPSLLFQPTFL